MCGWKSYYYFYNSYKENNMFSLRPAGFTSGAPIQQTTSILKKHAKAILPLCIAAVAAIGAASASAQTLVWSDEFNGTALDLNTWNIETGTGINGDWGTGQLDRATDRPE